MGKKVFKLEEIKDVRGRPFRTPVLNEEGEVEREVVKDSEGNPVLQVPRDQKGQAIPNCQPEPVYRIKTQPLGKDALPELAKSFFLNIPADQLTRQDVINGTRMFQNIAASKDGIMELDDDIHDWLKKKLQDEKVGLKLLGVDLYVVEQALDNFERPYGKKEE